MHLSWVSDKYTYQIALVVSTAWAITIYQLLHEWQWFFLLYWSSIMVKQTRQLLWRPWFTMAFLMRLVAFLAAAGSLCSHFYLNSLMFIWENIVVILWLLLDTVLFIFQFHSNLAMWFLFSIVFGNLMTSWQMGNCQFLNQAW